MSGSASCSGRYQTEIFSKLQYFGAQCGGHCLVEIVAYLVAIFRICFVDCV